MNKDIKIMIELQRFWQNILLEEKNIERNEKSIKFWNDDLQQKKNNADNIKNYIKKLKSSIKENELKLAELDAKVKKLVEKRISIIKEKELTAVDHEIDIVKKDTGEIEEKILNDMDNLEEKEKECQHIMDDLEQSEKQVKNDIAAIEEKNEASVIIISDNTRKYDDLKSSLSAQYSSKFEKMLKSKNGIAISEVNNNVCSGCNFQIPASLAAEASKQDSITNCTNCGRFIYK